MNGEGKARARLREAPARELGEKTGKGKEKHTAFIPGGGEGIRKKRNIINSNREVTVSRRRNRKGWPWDIGMPESTGLNSD